MSERNDELGDTGPGAANDRVGYSRPPVGTRFRPGQSGNPRGRPRGARNLSTIVAAALSERVAVNEDGRRRRISKRDFTWPGSAHAVHAFRSRPGAGAPEGRRIVFRIGMVVHTDVNLLFARPCHAK